MLDRSAIAKALAKAIAHKQAGNHALAEEWAAHLIFLLDCVEICPLACEVQQAPAR
ncbi:hypothetical protein [Phenylobacterium sp.]|jgi:hypothetical protein|uniref:hypothetical protein n=1 Tax=Phenylobacterium sp. TaxID=1871053 RepID=UPI0037C5A8B0